MERPINTAHFYHDGRGPELQRIHWRADGRILAAIDYYNPDASHDPANLMHVRFLAPQVVMITPEEVIDYRRLGERFSVHRPAAMFDLGRSEWIQTFSPQHLSRCSHYQLMFYDELVDVISEGVECGAGGYSET